MTHAPDCPRFNHNPDNPACTCDHEKSRLAIIAAEPAVMDILAERIRQISVEGYTPEHDDEHVDSEIAMLAAVYAMPNHWQRNIEHAIGGPIHTWPVKRGPRRDQLIKAGALILAEIERIDRAAQK